MVGMGRESRRQLSVGMSRNDRMLPLLTGDVADAGLALTFDDGTPSEIFWRALHDNAYDVTEMSLAAHAILTSRGDKAFVGLPVFTSRMFRHGSIYVRAGSGIERPQDLAGKRVGIPEYQMTAAVWLRGILQEFYGVRPETIRWVTGGVNKPGRKERIELRLPPEILVRPIEDNETLDPLLVAGEIDAIMAPQMPMSFRQPESGVCRLFADSRAIEEAYYRQTKIFPIMHVLVVRRELMLVEPSLAPRLVALFTKAKDAAMAALYDPDALSVMSPWLIDDHERMLAVMGEDFWPYSIDANRTALETFIRYLDEQRLLDRPLVVSDLFARDC